MSKAAVTHRLNQMEGLWLLSKALGAAKVISRNNGGKNRSLVMRSEIREILLHDWDPLGLNVVSGDRSYDRHIGPILRILVGGRSIDDLVDCLAQIAKNELNVEAGSDEHLGRVAEKLLDVDVMLS